MLKVYIKNLKENQKMNEWFFIGIKLNGSIAIRKFQTL